MTDWDVNELIRRCIINFIGKIEDKRIDLSVNIPEDKTLVHADIDRITQVVTNLLDNAVKFCEDGGNIKIWTYESDGKVNVNISNTGQIIPPEDLKYIFDRFFKVDKSHNRKIPGTGIGCPSCGRSSTGITKRSGSIRRQAWGRCSRSLWHLRTQRKKNDLGKRG